MAGSVNLSRNTKVYYTMVGGTNTGYHDGNTRELQVMNGYTFTQGTDQQTIQITEAGATPNRGQRSFNTKLNPVDWKITTYVRPKKTSYVTPATMSAGGTISLITVGGVVTHSEIACTYSAGTTIPTSGLLCTVSGLTTTGTMFNTTTPTPISKVGTIYKWVGPASAAAGSAGAAAAIITPVANVMCAESVLWNALVSPYNQYGSGVVQPWVYATTAASLVATASNVHTLAPFSLIFKIDNTFYKVNGAAINSAEVSFGIDQIAQISWSGFGTAYTSFTTTDTGATELGSLVAADTTANFITNKLSTVSIGVTAGGAGGTDGIVTAGTAYSLPITGGSLSINNNLSYLTPEMVGVVNTPIGYFTGTRAVSGNLTAYLRAASGGTETSDLLNAVLSGAATAADNAYSMIISVGGQPNATHVEFAMNGCMLQIPSVDVQDVVSTTINFTAQGTTGTYPSAVYDINAANEFGVKYKSA